MRKRVRKLKAVRPRSRLRRKVNALARYEEWLRGRGAWWDARVRLRPPSEHTDTCPGGWGLACTGPIAKGEVIIQVPEAAAFSTQQQLSQGHPAAEQLLREAGLSERWLQFVPDVDCQLPLAAALLLARDKASTWWPKLCPAVTPEDCILAWNWHWPHGDDAQRQLLDGTELQAPVAAKQRRLSEEWALLQPVLAALGCPRASQISYVAACAVVLSRVQPWFGGAMVPFVDQANHGKPHVEFRLQRGMVRGRAVRDIAPGEILQSYGELSTADSLYRYGFADLAASASDIVVSRREVVTVTLPMIQEAAASQGCLGELPRASLMEKLGILEASPWDGVEGLLGVELGLSHRLAASGGVKGLRALVVAASCYVMAEEDWANLAAAPSQEASLAAALGATGSKIPPQGIAWASRAALAVGIGALELRRKVYRTSGLDQEERHYDEEIHQQADPLHIGVRQLRIIEQRILNTASDFLRHLLDSTLDT